MQKDRVAKKFNKHFYNYLSGNSPSSSEAQIGFGFARKNILKKVKKADKKRNKMEKRSSMGVSSRRGERKKRMICVKEKEIEMPCSINESENGTTSTDSIIIDQTEHTHKHVGCIFNALGDCILCSEEKEVPYRFPRPRSSSQGSPSQSSVGSPKGIWGEPSTSKENTSTITTEDTDTNTKATFLDKRSHSVISEKKRTISKRTAMDIDKYEYYYKQFNLNVEYLPAQHSDSEMKKKSNFLPKQVDVSKSEKEVKFTKKNVEFIAPDIDKGEQYYEHFKNSINVKKNEYPEKKKFKKYKSTSETNNNEDVSPLKEFKHGAPEIDKDKQYYKYFKKSIDERNKKDIEKILFGENYYKDGEIKSNFVHKQVMVGESKPNMKIPEKNHKDSKAAKDLLNKREYCDFHREKRHRTESEEEVTARKRFKKSEHETDRDTQHFKHFKKNIDESEKKNIHERDLNLKDEEKKKNILQKQAKASQSKNEVKFHKKNLEDNKDSVNTRECCNFHSERTTSEDEVTPRKNVKHSEHQTDKDEPHCKYFEKSHNEENKKDVEEIHLEEERKDVEEEIDTSDDTDSDEDRSVYDFNDTEDHIMLNEKDDQLEQGQSGSCSSGDSKKEGSLRKKHIYTQIDEPVKKTSKTENLFSQTYETNEEISRTRNAYTQTNATDEEIPRTKDAYAQTNGEISRTRNTYTQKNGTDEISGMRNRNKKEYISDRNISKTNDEEGEIDTEPDDDSDEERYVEAQESECSEEEEEKFTGNNEIGNSQLDECENANVEEIIKDKIRRGSGAYSLHELISPDIVDAYIDWKEGLIQKANSEPTNATNDITPATVNESAQANQNETIQLNEFITSSDTQSPDMISHSNEENDPNEDLNSNNNKKLEGHYYTISFVVNVRKRAVYEEHQTGNESRHGSSNIQLDREISGEKENVQLNKTADTDLEEQQVFNFTHFVNTSEENKLEKSEFLQENTGRNNAEKAALSYIKKLYEEEVLKRKNSFRVDEEIPKKRIKFSETFVQSKGDYCDGNFEGNIRNSPNYEQEQTDTGSGHDSLSDILDNKDSIDEGQNVFEENKQVDIQLEQEITGETEEQNVQLHKTANMNAEQDEVFKMKHFMDKGQNSFEENEVKKSELLQGNIGKNKQLSNMKKVYERKVLKGKYFKIDVEIPRKGIKTMKTSNSDIEMRENSEEEANTSLDNSDQDEEKISLEGKDGSSGKTHTTSLLNKPEAVMTEKIEITTIKEEAVASGSACECFEKKYDEQNSEPKNVIVQEMRPGELSEVTSENKVTAVNNMNKLQNDEDVKPKLFIDMTGEKRLKIIRNEIKVIEILEISDDEEDNSTYDQEIVEVSDDEGITTDQEPQSNSRSHEGNSIENTSGIIMEQNCAKVKEEPPEYIEMNVKDSLDENALLHGDKNDEDGTEVEPHLNELKKFSLECDDTGVAYEMNKNDQKNNE